MQPIQVDCMALELGSWWVVISLWEMVWKGLAMWRSAKNDQKYWFIAVFIFNTIGILPIMYLYFFSRKKMQTFGDIEPLAGVEKLEPLPELKEATPKKKKAVKKVKKAVKKAKAKTKKTAGRKTAKKRKPAKKKK